MKTFLVSVLWLMTLAVGMAAGFEVRKNGEGRRLDMAYQGGFQSCQEQF